jgi:hypothetical protein
MHRQDPDDIHELNELHTELDGAPDDPDALRRAVLLLLQREARRAGALGEYDDDDPDCPCGEEPFT